MAARSLHNPSAKAQRVYGYARVSTDRQADSGISLDDKSANSKRGARRTAGTSSTSMSTPASPGRHRSASVRRAPGCSLWCAPATS